MKVLPLHSELIAYLKKRRLEKKFEKQKLIFEILDINNHYK